MKRLGFILVALLLLIGAQTKAFGINMDSLKNEIIRSSQEIHDLQKDSLLFSKLSPNQLLELKQQEFEVKKQELENSSRSDMPLNGFGIVMICLLPFLFVATIIFINAKERNKESQRRYDIYMKSLEMGQTIPDHFFDQPKKKTNPVSSLKRGAICLAVGLSLLVCFFYLRSNIYLIGGIIPTFVGIGYLVVNFLEKPKTETPEN